MGRTCRSRDELTEWPPQPGLINSTALCDVLGHVCALDARVVLVVVTVRRVGDLAPAEVAVAEVDVGVEVAAVVVVVPSLTR